MEAQMILEHTDMRYTYVNGYERLYRLYIDGEIWSVRSGKFLKQELSKGYKRVTLCINGKTKRYQAHRLVAMHFILNPLKKPCVNHKDGDRINNHMRNLEWCTYKENENHSYDILGKINHNRKLSAEALEDIRSNAIKGVNKSNKGNVDKFASKYNVKSGTILNVLKNKFYVRT
jgi:hypothetical protein